MAASLVYAAALGTLLVAPLDIVRYHSAFWNLLWRHGIVWSARREHALDETLNVALFIPFGILVHRWWRVAGASSRLAVWGTLGTALLVAVIIEGTQMFLPSRHASIIDVVAYLVGASAGLTIDASCSRPERG